MADTNDQASGFWTLSRQPKLSKRRNSDLHELHHKIFNVAVVGFSGTERDKGPIGIGKSCLCNRFVRSAADDYHTDHISVLSQTDFNGHVVNNDHWLYWGSVIKSCDGYDLAFNVIEQTEFVDDICFQSFQSGKTEPYHKRCANTKLISPEKLMYICKNQLGIEKEYEQRYLPDGKFNVDGFLCLFDVSEVQGRSLEKQSEMTNMIMLNIIKTKKPVVFVTTKHDEASEQLVAEAERLISQRDFRGVIPVVETSAQENVNINIAFLICAQLIDRTRTKIRIPPFMEAYRNQMELLNAASNAYINLIQSTVVDLRTSWQQVCIKLSHNPEFLQYTYLLGLDRASAVFKEHIKSLQQECINRKVQVYMKSFPEILNTILPLEGSTSSGNTQDLKFSSSLSPLAWEAAKKHIKSHSLAPKFFLPIPDGILWYETEILESSENRIPTDWLDSEDAYSIYRHRCLQQETERKRQSTKELFGQILRDTDIPVGTPFFEVKHRFESNCDLEVLTDQELFEIYVEYQNDMLQQARANFQELLLENAEHLQQLTTSDKVIRQEDIKTINAILQHDERYQALGGFEQDRTLMMIRHLSFLHSQISEQCPSYPRCIEPEIERLLITKAKSLVSMFCEDADREGKSSSNMKPPKSCDIVIFGPRRPSQQLILALNVLNSRAPKSSQYQITFTVFDNADEIDTHFQRFGYQTTKKLNGCFGIFTNQRSLEHVSLTLERFMQLNTHAHSEINHFGGPPVVMLYAADITLDERTMLALENDGQQLADKFKCPFMNVTAIDQYRQHQQNNLLRNDQDSSSQVMSECASLDYACVEAAFNVLKEAISRRVCFMELYNNQDLIPRQAFNPDARILMCLLCGDPFSRESFIWEMFLDYPDCYVTSSKSICLKMTLEDGQEKFIEIMMTSYTHGALNYREDLLHGFILVCSTERKASISILNAFSFNIPCIPVLVMAIMNLEGQKSHTKDNRSDSDITEDLVREAESTADRLKGHFEIYELGKRNASNSNRIMHRFKLFLHSVIKRKPLIERAYEIGDIDQSGYSDPVAFVGVTTSKHNTTDKLNADRSNLVELRRTTLSKASGSYDVEYKLGDTNGGLDKNNIREIGASNSNQTKKSTFDKYPVPMPASRLSKRPETGLHLESHVTQDEHTAATKRPLPPIPTAQDHQAQNRTADLPKNLSASATAANPSGQTKNKPTTTNIPGKSQQQQREHQQHQLQQQQLNCEETIDSEHSSDDDTEDSVDAKNKKAKPGRLDLRQFDNITTAIGKLNIQPTSTPQVQPKSSETSYSRRLQNSRHKHGRAVAPPKLPPGSSSKSSNEPPTELSSPKTLNEETGGLDFSQSPIAQRLLKYSHDHKVSELSSPYESDPDVPVTSSRVPKLNKVSKALSTDKSSPALKMTFKNAPSDSSELITSRDETIKQLNQILAKPPTRPGANVRMTRGVSLDQQPETSDQSDLKKNDKDAKKDKKKLRSDEKLEKQRHKEEERQRRLEKKSAAKKSKSNQMASDLNEDGVPLFIKRCIEFIEFEGLDAEGIYRVPGNRAHVETFVQKFKENPDMSIIESDIPVNAVATALKDFLSKKWGPIIPLAMMNELTELSKISDKEGRLMAIKQLLNKLPTANYKLLKYVFGHFVKISLNHSLNSMDSKNLAICWWPTLLPLHFNDMVMFEQMRPHLEESIQTMIDQYEFIFDSEEPSSPQALVKT